MDLLFHINALPVRGVGRLVPADVDPVELRLCARRRQNGFVTTLWLDHRKGSTNGENVDFHERKNGYIAK